MYGHPRVGLIGADVAAAPDAPALEVLAPAGDSLTTWFGLALAIWLVARAAHSRRRARA
jgi:hypothetical protein